MNRTNILALVLIAVFGFALAHTVLAADTDCTPGYCNPGQDTDNWVDAWDNCLTVDNDEQLDTDHDGIGNACDGDLDNNGIVNATDFALFRSRLNTNDPDADFDDSGTVTARDFNMLRQQLNHAPGPAAPAYKTVGGDVYDGLLCVEPDCTNGVFNPANNVVLRTVTAGERCFMVPVNTAIIPTGIPNGVWGFDAASLEPGNLIGDTRCVPLVQVLP